MNDKTLGEYKRTTPDPDETTGEALARLQAELTRLLDEADAELRDEADGGVAAALIEKEAEKHDAAHDIDWQAVAEQHEETIKALTAERDEAWAATCTDKDAHWRLDEANAALEQMAKDFRVVRAQRDDAGKRARKTEQERDHWKREADGANEDLAHLRAAESRPLTPDAIKDLVREREQQITQKIREAYNRDPRPSSLRIAAAVYQGLTMPPVRPGGAEEWREELDEMPAAQDLTPKQRDRLADALAERDHALGVRVVGEDDGGDETPDVCPHVGGPGGDCGCPL